MEQSVVQPPVVQPRSRRFGAWLFRIVQHPRLPYALALICIILSLPSLWVGFHLDDHVGRFLLSDLPGAERLIQAYGALWGTANGRPSDIHWQIENGYAPWWTDKHLLISFWRPISEVTHKLDLLLWPSSAFAMHVQNLLWFAALVIAVTKLYRRLMGATVVAGLASVLYAFDHSHGFAVGWIANRNVLMAAFFGVLAMHSHHSWRSGAGTKAALLSPVLFLCGLLSGEATIAVFGYLFAYALFLDRGRPVQRLMSLLPCVGVLVLWRLTYNLLGFGARGSALYIDPVSEPLQFTAAALERIPLLVLGQFALPPAEAYLYAPPGLASAIWVFAVVVLVALAVAAVPILLRNAQARFWALGMCCALVPLCTSHPNNRLLFFVGLGAMALLAQLWYGMLQKESWVWPYKLWRRFAHPLVGTLAGFHLFLSPLLLPLAVCAILLGSSVNRAVASFNQEVEVADKDVVIVNSPDYFLAKLIPMLRALEGLPQPRRFRVLAFGAIPLKVTRLDSRTLSIAFEGGILQSPLMQLYRDADIPMRRGQRIDLKGLRIEVTETTPDGRASRAEFSFDAKLQAERFQWLQWGGSKYVPFVPPKKRATVRLPPARVPYGVW